jgi:hypothetical protein
MGLAVLLECTHRLKVRLEGTDGQQTIHVPAFRLPACDYIRARFRGHRQSPHVYAAAMHLPPRFCGPHRMTADAIFFFTSELACA